MPGDKSPRLRTVEKVKPPYPLNKFPKDFGFRVGKEIIYLLATKGRPDLEGSEWENIFASCVGADWKPSNVGLDDIVLDTCAWGAKTVKSVKPSEAETVRLISGRNSPTYSYGLEAILKADPDDLGKQILNIWNERVSAIRKKYKHLRTVVLIKSRKLDEAAVFEFETIRYDPELYRWEWNENKNLIGFEKSDDCHRFTWQPHGSQFTIVEDVPIKRLIIKMKVPPQIDKEQVLKVVGFDESWITVIEQHG
jgi:hypothetical protein